MAISFNRVPTGNLTPFTYVEFDNSQANRNSSNVQPYKILVIGQKLPGGKARSGSILPVADENEAANLFGLSSSLHHMFRVLKRNNTQIETFAIALDDPGTDASREFKLKLEGIPENDTEYSLVFRKGAQTKTARFTSTPSATALKILNGLKTEADKVDVVSQSSISGGTLQFVLATGWEVDGGEKLSIELPQPETGRSTGSFVIQGTPTEDGILSAHVGDRLYQIPVKSGESSNDIAERLSIEIVGDDLAYAKANVTGSTVNIVSKHRGLIGEDVTLQFNYYPWDKFPDGLEGSSITPMTGGVSNPSLEDTIESIDEEQYNVLTSPYLDPQNLKLLDEFLERRWGPEEPLDGHVFLAINRTHNAILDFSNQVNSKHFSIMESEDVPTPSYMVAAALAGVNALYASIDPARPQQTLEIRGVFPPKTQKKRELRNALLNRGIATHTTRAGKVYIERLVTSYTRNALGAVDPSYRDVAIKQTLSYLRWDFRNFFGTRYPRHKLAIDTARIAAGQAVITPKSAKAEAISIFNRWERMGLVEGIEQFKKELVVEINGSDPNRLDFLLPPNLINQLRIIGAQIAYVI